MYAKTIRYFKRNILFLFFLYIVKLEMLCFLKQIRNCFVSPSKKVKRDKKQSESISGFIVKQYIHSTGKKDSLASKVVCDLEYELIASLKQLFIIL